MAGPVCCGSGRALIQAARQVDRAGLAGQVVLVGLDLVDAFDAVPGSAQGLELVCAPVAAWESARSFDLITCVHGPHYIGDKLALLTRAAGWLTPAGRLVADLDLAAVQVGGPAAARRLRSRLRAAGFATVPAVTRSPAPADARSACRTPASARTTAPGPATPGSLPSPPTTPKTPDTRPPRTAAKPHAARNRRRHRVLRSCQDERLLYARTAGHAPAVRRGGEGWLGGCVRDAEVGVLRTQAAVASRWRSRCTRTLAPS